MGNTNGVTETTYLFEITIVDATPMYNRPYTTAFNEKLFFTSCSAAAAGGGPAPAAAADEEDMVMVALCGALSTLSSEIRSEM